MPIVSLFTEARVGMAPARKLEETSRRCRNGRHVYSLGAGAAADMLYSLVADPVDTATRA